MRHLLYWEYKFQIGYLCTTRPELWLRFRDCQGLWYCNLRIKRKKTDDVYFSLTVYLAVSMSLNLFKLTTANSAFDLTIIFCCAWCILAAFIQIFPFIFAKASFLYLIAVRIIAWSGRFVLTPYGLQCSFENTRKYKVDDKII